MSAFSSLGGSSSSDDRKSPFLTARQAAEKFVKSFGFDSSLEFKIANEIEQCKDDPMMIVSVNNEWITANGQNAADQILDFMATWPNLPIANRRDSRMPHVIYHFIEINDIVACRQAMIHQFPRAFAYSQRTIDDMVNSGIPLAMTQNINRISFARVGLVTKINQYDNDACEDIGFFFR